MVRTAHRGRPAILARNSIAFAADWRVTGGYVDLGGDVAHAAAVAENFRADRHLDLRQSTRQILFPSKKRNVGFILNQKILKTFLRPAVNSATRGRPRLRPDPHTTYGSWNTY